MGNLTKQEIQNLLTLLNRVPITGTQEAVALVNIAQKLEKSLQNDTDK